MIISIVNHKGGTGKSTTTANLGSALANEGFNVLLVDLDAQGNLSYSLGITELNRSISHLFLEECLLKEAIYQYENLSVIPANHSLANVEISIANALERFNHLKDILAAAVGYDYVLIDCPPSLSLLNANALNASQGVIIPMQMEVLSVKGLEMILETISTIKASINPDLEILGVLPVMADVRKNLYKEISEYVHENFSVPIFKNVIRSSVKAAEAPSFGKSVVHYAPASTAAKDYCLFAKELISHTQLINQ